MLHEERAVIDMETGEYLTQLQPGDRIIKKQILDRIADQAPVDKQYICPDNWGKAYDNATNKLARLNLSASEYKAILLMLPLVRLGSGLVAYGNYKPVSADWIADQLQISEASTYRVLARLQSLRIISKSISGNEVLYFFNPYIYMRGRYINKSLYEIFRRSQWAEFGYK